MQRYDGSPGVCRKPGGGSRPRRRARPGAHRSDGSKVGHTGITWGYKPDDAEQAIHDVGSLGFRGYESFGEVIEAWEAKGGIQRLLDAANVPLISAYCNVNLTDPTKRKDETEKIVRWAKLIQKCGGVTAVVGPNSVRRSSYDFKASKANIVAALNEMCKAVTDVGIIPALHQHTGTCIESRDEVYAVLEAVDTRYVKFGPDVGQLAKGGSDPVKVVKDFLPSDSPRALKGLERRTVLGRVLPAGARQSRCAGGAGPAGTGRRT